LLSRRWVWGILGAAATAYLMRRSKQAGPRRVLARSRAFDASRWGRSAIDTAMRAGRSVAESTMRALARARG